MSRFTSLDNNQVVIFEGKNKEKFDKVRKTYLSEIERARITFRTLGAKAAAGYLKKRGWSIEAAIYALFGKGAIV